MIKVKVFKVREMIVRFLMYILIAASLYSILIFIMKFLSYNIRKFDFSIVEKNIGMGESILGNDLKLKIILGELPIESKISKQVPDLIVAKEIENNDINKTNELNEKQYLSYDNIQFQSRDSSYDVKEISANKIQVGKAYINNQSGIKLNLDELRKVSDYKIDSDTSFLIYHTHTSEAYEEIGLEDNFRSIDDTYNVVSVGNTLAENLKLKKFDVMHDITKHDTPSYNGAYNNSLETVENIFKNKKYNIVIDLHRDALSGNLHFRPTTQINGETVSKIMFVVGTNGSGLQHDNWMENLKLALLIQNTGEEMYPGLFRDLNLAKYRYNQHLSDGAFILEVGCTGNTLDDTKNAMKYFSNVLAALKQ